MEIGTAVTFQSAPGKLCDALVVGMERPGGNELPFGPGTSLPSAADLDATVAEQQVAVATGSSSITAPITTDEPVSSGPVVIPVTTEEPVSA